MLYFSRLFKASEAPILALALANSLPEGKLTHFVSLKPKFCLFFNLMECLCISSFVEEGSLTPFISLKIFYLLVYCYSQKNKVPFLSLFFLYIFSVSWLKQPMMSVSFYCLWQNYLI